MADKAGHGYFYIRRLDSLLGIFPIWIFLIFYFFINSFAFRGPAAFNRAVGHLGSIPLLTVAEIVFIGLPILFHAVLGLVVFYTGRNNFLNYSYYRNWIYFLYRFTGVIAFVFITVHIWGAHISPALDGRRISYDDVQKLLGPAWVKWFYVVGIVAVVFHFTNGICEALIDFGITASRRSQRVASIAGWVVFALMSVWGIAIMWAFD